MPLSVRIETERLQWYQSQNRGTVSAAGIPIRNSSSLITIPCFIRFLPLVAFNLFHTSPDVEMALPTE